MLCRALKTINIAPYQWKYIASSIGPLQQKKKMDEIVYNFVVRSQKFPFRDNEPSPIFFFLVGDTEYVMQMMHK